MNFSDLKKVAKTFFKNAKYQSEKKTYFVNKIILVPMSHYVKYVLKKTELSRNMLDLCRGYHDTSHK